MIVKREILRLMINPIFIKGKDLRKNISIVTQDITLFDDTIKNNILYANPNASEKEILDCCKKFFCSKDFIEKLTK